MTHNPAPFLGPLEEHRFPTQLNARVITAGHRPHVHGYDVEGDLARHYGATELVLLTLTGELPTEAARHAFEVVWLFAAPISVAHASTHAAVLARLCGSPVSATIGAAAIGLAEQARCLLEEHEELLDWLKHGASPLPARFTTTSPDDVASVERLRAALPSELGVPALSESPSRDAALLCVLYACGLRRREQLEAALVLARLPGTLSEAFAERATNFGKYPINLPAYRYQETP